MTMYAVYIAFRAVTTFSLVWILTGNGVKDSLRFMDSLLCVLLEAYLFHDMGPKKRSITTSE